MLLYNASVCAVIGSPSRSIIAALLERLPSRFSQARNPEPVLLPTIESAVSALSSTGGKIICSLATLPTTGPGRLFLRDKNDLHGMESEKKLFQTEHPGFRKLAGKMVESGIGIDFFIAAPAGKYMDVATIGMFCQLPLVMLSTALLTPNAQDIFLLSQVEKHSSTLIT